MNNAVLIGRLTSDPQLKYLPGAKGSAVCTFTLAIDREYTGKDGKKETDFINIQVWNKKAENCANYLVKGSLVAVDGRIRIENYLKDDEKRRATWIVANRVQFLDKRKADTSDNGFEPSPEQGFIPSGLDPQGWNSMDDDDIPF